MGLITAQRVFVALILHHRHESKTNTSSSSDELLVPQVPFLSELMNSYSPKQISEWLNTGHLSRILFHVSLVQLSENKTPFCNNSTDYFCSDFWLKIARTRFSKLQTNNRCWRKRNKRSKWIFYHNNLCIFTWFKCWMGNLMNCTPSTLCWTALLSVSTQGKKHH